MIRRSVLWSGGHVVGYSHRPDAVFVLDAYADVLPLIADAIKTGDARRHLRGSTVELAFRRTGQFNTKPAPPVKDSASVPSGPARFSLADSVVVITGAGGLLGREHALAVSEARGTLILMDVDDNSLASLAIAARGCQRCAEQVAADVTSPGDLDRVLRTVLERFGRVDALVNNAALNDKVEAPTLGVDEARTENYPLDAWRRMLDVNVTGVFLPCQVFGAQMVRRGSGSIINIASTYALVGSDPALYIQRDGTLGTAKHPRTPRARARRRGAHETTRHAVGRRAFA
jgi:NAD(P)-dependent dehydrogenase (short-subunit alcohol dehydrogenase family)